MAPFYSKHYTVFGGSGLSSTYTSGPYMVHDMGQLSVSWHSSGGASRLTIMGTNESGAAASLVTWSDVTALTLQGIYAVEPGMRFLRFTRTSVDSLGQVFLTART